MKECDEIRMYLRDIDGYWDHTQFINKKLQEIDEHFAKSLVQIKIIDLPEMRDKFRSLREEIEKLRQDNGAWPTDWATRLVQAKFDERKRILEFLSGYFGALGINLNVNHFISLLEE
jgi:hypothetical protein